ncbi:hypothetical protein CVO74_19390 [Xanthomonas prunicola]|uniref:Serine kinase n=1 Tax=Xanthomonas prunicola TaxID=2053930 RepID=A0A2N3RGD7_9XANT|nr:hypothetical protein XpruCFBP8353_17050 [Xanthomonas prunicola]PKV15609.1 hypothetical protein XpruCFBP8354_18170 [Xanthomonas prunicola]PKV19671.1 hypothetical protein CVO74_19390 [Xanthomonas prunicola]
MPEPQHHYLLCGWHVRSTLALPELPPWPASAAGRHDADVVIEDASLPSRLDSADPTDTWLSIGTDGSVLLQIPDLVRILVRGGRSIQVQRLRQDDESWRLFLLGSALGYLCLQRGLFPLHAACLRIGSRTVAIAGHSGAGKSTLSAALLKRGHGLLSDDLAVIRTEGRIEVLPAFPRLKLWRDTLDSLQMPHTGLPQIRPGMDKFDLRPQSGFDPTPAPLDAIVILKEAPELRMQRHSPGAALPLLHSYLTRPQAARRLGLWPTTFAQAAVIARQVPVWHLLRPLRFDALDAGIELIEAHLAT